MVDDLKDVLGNAAQAGKTVARDLLLDRPNAASAMGIPDAIQRLTRFIRIGDRTLFRILKTRPHLTFLEKLRSELEEELVRVTGHFSAIPVGECS